MTDTSSFPARAIARSRVLVVGDVMLDRYWFGEVDRIAKLVPTVLNITLKDALAMSQELKGSYEKDPTARKILDLAMALEGLPRHASTHAAGLVIAKDSLNSQVPVQNSADGFITTQFDKDCIEEIGFL